MPVIDLTRYIVASAGTWTDPTQDRNLFDFTLADTQSPERLLLRWAGDFVALTGPLRVRFHISVPSAGRYLLSVYYGNQTEHIGQQIMRLDDQPWSFISYPPTLNWAFRSHQDLYLQLTAGPHTITFGTFDPSIGTAGGQVTLNVITLACAPGQIAGVTGPATHYPAAFADLSGNATVGYGRSGGSGPGYVRARSE